MPILFEAYKPNSVLDIGCGLGNWIEVAKKMGVENVIGVDGDYVNKLLLKIEESEFVERDLTKPFDLERKFDLAICLEVAEHLPATSAENLIKSITRHTDVIMFSAALPGQGGQNHINEQWPEYWQELFERYDFEMVDFFRFKIWNNVKIERWYRQNLFLVVRKGHFLGENGNKNIFSLVHPELLTAVIEQNAQKTQQLQATINKLSQRDIIGRVTKCFRSIIRK